MTRTKIYDAEGYEYGKEKDERNEQIPNFLKSGVRAIFDVSSTSFKMICYFRATEKGGESESFYAEYGSDSSGDAFQECKGAIEREAEELGLEMDYSHESTHILRDMDEVDPEFPGVSETYERGIQRLIQEDEKEKLDFGASDYNVATRAAKAAAYKNRVVAISNNGRVSAIKNVDVVFDTGYNGTELEPSKETERKIKYEMVPSNSRQSATDAGDKDTRSTQPDSVFGRYPLPVMALGCGVIFVLLAFGPLSGSVGIPVLGDLIINLPGTLKNIIEAVLILAVVIAISGVLDLVNDSTYPGETAASAVSAITTLVIIATAYFGILGM